MNLPTAWIDYSKVYNIVPHSSIIRCLKLAIVSENIDKFIQRSTFTWETKITWCGHTLGELKIKTGIFQGESFSPLTFVTSVYCLPNFKK